MKSHGEIEINRPIEDVFRLTTEHVAEWSIVVVTDKMTHETKDVVGSTFVTVTVTHDRGQEMEFQGIITKHDPPNLHAVGLEGKLFNIKTEYWFQSVADRTHVSQRTQVNGKGFFKILLPIMGILMKKSHCEATFKELQSLKDFCETDRS